MFKMILRCVSFTVFLVTLNNTNAQSFPSKPIRLIVPYAPGGTVEALARLIAQKMGDHLGQPIVIDSRPGASGTLGTQLAAKSAPDGHTLLVTSLSPLVINVSMFPGKPPYDPERDLSPVSLITRLPLVIAVHSDTPLHNVMELITLAKANPGKLTYGTSGSGSINHLTGELFKSAAGMDMLHVPFKGAGPSVVALLSKQIDIIVAAPPSITSFIRTGRLRGIAVSGVKRSPALPDVPTIGESGIPGFNATAWYCLMTAGNTPRSITNKLRVAMLKSLETPQISERLLGEGGVPEPSTPEELGSLIHSEIPKWAKIVKASGATLE